MNTESGGAKSAGDTVCGGNEGMGTIAVYPGSFDPFTNGHLDILTRASRMFSKVIISIANNPRKSSTFSVEERMEMIRESCGDLENVEIGYFETLLVHYVKKSGAAAIIRGLRAISDYDYEFQMALTNKKLLPEADTIFLVTRLDYLYVSSSMVKEIYRLEGDINCLVPEPVMQHMVSWKARDFR